MKLEGTKEFDAPRAVVWSVINDPEKMAKTMPGVESFEIADDTHWSAKVKVPLGLGGLTSTTAPSGRWRGFDLERRRPGGSCPEAIPADDQADDE